MQPPDPTPDPERPAEKWVLGWTQSLQPGQVLDGAPTQSFVTQERQRQVAAPKGVQPPAQEADTQRLLTPGIFQSASQAAEGTLQAAAPPALPTVPTSPAGSHTGLPRKVRRRWTGVWGSSPPPPTPWASQGTASAREWSAGAPLGRLRAGGQPSRA